VCAALGEVQPEPLEGWVSGIRRVADAHRAELDTLPALESRWRRLCELNVEAQVAALRRNRILCAAWGRGQALVVHGWIFDVESGLLRDLGVSADRPLDDAGG
jgi:carbonic anhydrase